MPIYSKRYNAVLSVLSVYTGGGHIIVGTRTCTPAINTEAYKVTFMSRLSEGC